MVVRLAGIITPEIPRAGRSQGQIYSQGAKEYLGEVILHRVVEIKGYGLDQHDRVLGEVFLRGKNINLEMVRTGLSEVCRGKPPMSFDLEPYLKIEEEARKAKRGMWALAER